MISAGAKRLAAVAAIIGLLVIVSYARRDQVMPWFFEPTSPASEATPSVPAAGADGSADKESGVAHVVMTDLHVPWETARLPDGTLLVTERDGILRWLEVDGTKRAFTVEGTAEVGEGGLLGLALAPDFESSRHIYLYQTVRAGRGYANRVMRYIFDGALREPQVILDGIPASQYHNGGRIAFGPDDMLYVTTGDASDVSLAQDTRSLGGKILRLKPDGSVPDDNPFGNAVWSYGHRNSQGLAWDDRGRLWSTEHGRSGIASGYDELNLIVKGGNYGWPVAQGAETRDGMISPVHESGANETWAPAGIAFADGSLYFAGLRGAALYEARPDEHGQISMFKAHYRREFGRLRAVRADGPYLYMTTSNGDGRGTLQAGDDKVLRLMVSGIK